MQIKERGGKLVFTRYKWSPERKRSVAHCIGTQDVHLHTVNKVIEELMTEDEKAEAKAWLAERKERKTREMAAYYIENQPYYMKEVISYLDNDDAVSRIDKAVFDEIYHSMTALAKAMRAKGFTRPKRKNA